MSKKIIAVFAAGANPAVDQPSYHVTQHEAAQRVANHHYLQLSATRIQRPPLILNVAGEAVIIHTSFTSAWAQLPSGVERIPVWQMRRQR